MASSHSIHPKKPKISSSSSFITASNFNLNSPTMTPPSLASTTTASIHVLLPSSPLNNNGSSIQVSNAQLSKIQSMLKTSMEFQSSMTPPP
ncbi:hypothetical protein P8452_16880 [Trifolium repens]|nr:hypothetical protein P8452_16880 [Trifolium repens]